MPGLSTILWICAVAAAALLGTFGGYLYRKNIAEKAIGSAEDEATRIIKSRMPEIPIVALTANAFQSDRDMALAAGCDEFLSKPVNSQLCLDTIAKFIAQ